MMMRSCGGGGGSKTASKSHSQAEKRRRDRINAQLATLRKLIPMSHKMDKAALLSSAVDHVKELKIKVAETRELLADIPADTDEVVVVHGSDDQQQTGSPPPPIAGRNILRASVCCEDRPELFAEINSALRELRLTTLHAEVSCLGGRVKGVFLLLCPEGEEGICVNTAKQSLKVALSKVVMPCSTNSYRIKSKRQRFFLPPTHYYYQ
ncbi:unnamed protein product [Cuscuta campestris]|uniref:BHLH domain-containing protein n=1 Tax=Cuscuta campestris TaxID=132261 RepID=A0A484NI35_9ASTE|nr:unnamed protein product [Cuscuta campestris]